MIQYNAVLAVATAIQGFSSEKIYQELGLESLQSRRWFRKLYQFYNIKKKSHQYLFNIIQLNYEFTIPGIVIIFLYLKTSIITLEPLFFPLQSLSGINDKQGSKKLELFKKDF